MTHDEVDIDTDRLRWQISCLARLRHPTRPQGELGVHRLGEVVYLTSDEGVVVGEIPLWRIRHYSGERLAMLWARICEAAGFDESELQGAVAIAPPDSEWVTISTRSGGDLPVHRSAIVDGWPSDEPVHDAPELTSALVSALR